MPRVDRGCVRPMPVLIPEGVPEEAAARKALAFEGVRRRLVAGRASRFMLALWASVSSALCLGHLLGAPGGVVALALGGFFFAWLDRRWVVAAAQHALDETVAEISLGRLPEADGALAAMRGAFWIRRSFARTVALQSAMVATRRGDLARARADLDDALAAAPATGTDGLRPGSRHERDACLALRALVLASAGELALARADIEAVRARDAADEARARVSLAEALVLQRTGERERLRELLEEHGTLLREALHPRERAMVRALTRWLRAPRVTPYRHAEVTPTSEQPPVETWVERLAPGLAGFVDASARVRLEHSPLAPNLTVAAPTHAGLRAIREARRARGASLWPLIAIAGGAVVALAWTVLGAAPASPGAEVTDVRGGAQVAVSFVAFAVLFGGLVTWLGRDVRRAREAQRLSVVRHRARALTRTGPELAALTESGDARTAALAALALAEAAERRGSWHEVLARTEKGLRRVAKRRDAVMVVGELASLRAFALSVFDRRGEAEAELASLARAYPHGPRALLRVRLVEAIRRGKLDEAQAHVERHAADLPLSVREEALVDLLRVVHDGSGVSGAEATRLRAELAQDPDLRSWLDGVAPALLARFEGAEGAKRTRIAPCATGETRTEDEVAAEHEVSVETRRVVESLAEEECHQGSSSASTARLTS